MDWDTLQIVEAHDDEGRIELISEDQLYEILGLGDEDQRTKMVEPPRIVEQRGDTEGAVIPVSDAIPDEVVITYDKDHPKMDLGTMYLAINEEFELGTQASDKQRYRVFCKSSENCPWRLVGRLQGDEKTVKVKFY